MVSQIYPIELQLNKAKTFDTEALFSNYDLSITNGIVFELYSCPMKTHHSSDAHICGLSKAVQKCAIYN